MKQFFFLAASVLFFSLTTQAQQIELNFTNPKCQAYEGKPQNAFCTRADLPRAQTNPTGPYQKVLSLLKKVQLLCDGDNLGVRDQSQYTETCNTATIYSCPYNAE